MGYPTPIGHELQAYFEIADPTMTLFYALPYLTAVIAPFVSQYFIHMGNEKFFLRGIAVIAVLSWVILWKADPCDSLLLFTHQALAGLFLGATNFVIPYCLANLRTDEHLSLFTALHQFGLGCGFLSVNVAGLWFDWWELSYMGSLMSALFLFGVGFLPDVDYNGLVRQNGIIISQSDLIVARDWPYSRIAVVHSGVVPDRWQEREADPFTALPGTAVVWSA
jgi:hypothetical protein